MKRTYLVLALILTLVVALVGTLWLNEGLLWRLVMLREVDQYFDNGELNERYHVRRWGKEVRHGPAMIFWSNGAKQIQGWYRNGASSGVWKHWDNRGRLVGMAQWQDDVIVNGIWTWAFFWEPDGSNRPFSQHRVIDGTFVESRRFADSYDEEEILDLWR